MSFKFLTYNIDGLNPAAITYRTNTALSLILSESPDVVQLQEVVADTAAIIIKTMTKNGYTSFHEADRSSGMCHYFTLSFARSEKISNPVIRRIPFSGAARSEQGRDLLQLNLTFMKQQWMFINCHLESCGTAFKSPGSAIRMAQLREGLARITAHSNVGPAILAGDLNIRDPEATKIMLDYTRSIVDASLELETGRKSNTWFMPAPSKYSARYDRVYSNTGCNLRPVLFRVIGGEDIIEGTGLDELYELPYNTPSDHRGVVVTYTFDAPADVSSKFAAGLTSSAHGKHEKGTATATGIARTATSLGTASIKRERPSNNTAGTIPSHAEVICLDDSDSDSAPASTGANKRVKCEQSGSSSASDSDSGDGSSDAVLTARERRELFLRALEKRGNV